MKHCKPPYVARDGRAACYAHTHCKRHWRVCKDCGSAAGRTLQLADPLRAHEAKQLERERERDAAQLPLPGAK